MANHLSSETSPYLLQHASNPVDWFSWGEDALQKARSEDKPIFLSIGYAACHWCHVMEKESFEDLETANLLNRSFVSVKVDREERPDLDMIYMQAVVNLTGSGGWPLSVFLTPEGEPFYGGTYFPPIRRFGMPAFREVLEAIERLWREDRPHLDEVAQQIIERMVTEIGWRINTNSECSPRTLEKAAQRLIETYDWIQGGWGNAPRFPAPMSIDFLLTQAARGDQTTLQPALHALRAMAQGGMYDLVGGGFHRYSTDDRWLVPHFEKMLYDNAQLAQAYLHAFLLSGDPFFKQICEDTLEFIKNELTHPGGGFFSSLDADSEGEEGKFYLWTFEELQSACTSEDFELLRKNFEVNPGGNFEGKIILRRLQFPNELPGEKENETRRILSILKEKRAQKLRPSVDDKVLTFWNALALQAFAEAGRYLKRDDFLIVAQQNASFLAQNLQHDNTLLRSWRNGKAHQNAFLEDYGALAASLLCLYQADFDIRWFGIAHRLIERMVADFQDLDGGFFATDNQSSELVLRPKDMQDNATPAGNSMAATAILLISAYEENSNWRVMAEKMLGGMQEIIERYPSAFSNWLKALNLAVGPTSQVVFTYPDSQAKPTTLIDIVNQTFRPLTILFCSAYPLPKNAPGILQLRQPINNLPTLFICTHFVCQLPLTEPELIKQQISVL